MDDWLKKRLPPVKIDNARWSQLAEAIQELWESEFDPELAYLGNIRSIYTADAESLFKKIEELGAKFQADLPSPENRAIAVGWRRQQLEFKDTTGPLIETLYCLFEGMPVEWLPLYAKKADAYGTAFYAEKEITDDPYQYFLTSRGRIQVDLGHLLRHGINRDEFFEKASPFINELIPLHIIYEGLIYLFSFQAEMEPADFIGGSMVVDKNITFGFSLESKYDVIPADVQETDGLPFECKIEPDWNIQLDQIDAEQPTPSDNYVLYDDIPADFCPADLTIGELNG